MDRDTLPFKKRKKWCFHDSSCQNFTSAGQGQQKKNLFKQLASSQHRSAPSVLPKYLIVSGREAIGSFSTAFLHAAGSLQSSHPEVLLIYKVAAGCTGNGTGLSPPPFPASFLCLSLPTWNQNAAQSSQCLNPTKKCCFWQKLTQAGGAKGKHTHRSPCSLA